MRFISFILLVTLFIAGCTPAVPAANLAEHKPPANPEVILATTTSTQDSGLLDMLVPLFQEQTGYQVKTVAVGTGQALKMGEDGNADVLLVHAPAAELILVEQGYSVDRRLVMHNDFVIVGPAEDQAGIIGMPAAADAFARISAAGAIFVSRGDDSGTHKSELSFWKKAGIEPEGQVWYLESGQGMAATLRIASEKAAYTLTDRATYLAIREGIDLEVLVEKDNALLNVYHVMTVNPEKRPKVNRDGATAFADFMVDPETQKLIGEFGVEKYGQALFIPDAGRTDEELGLPTSNQ